MIPEAEPVGIAWVQHSELQHRHGDHDRCFGMLRIIERDGPIWTVECDRCGYEAGLPERDAPSRVRGRENIDRAD